MIKIEKLSTPLSVKDIKKLDPLVDVRDRHFLRQHNPDDCILWVAFDQAQPIGIVLLISSDLPYFAEIHSLFVLPAYRHRSIGSQLLEKAEEQLVKNENKYSTLFFRYDPDTFNGTEKFLQKRGWQPSKCSSLLYLFHSALFDPSWLQNFEKTFQPPFHEVHWAKASRKDLEYLKLLEREKAYPVLVSPFREESLIEPMNSLVLYKGEEEIVGWMITHRILPHMIRYHALFVERKYKYTGYSMKLLCDSIKLQIKSTVPYALVEINTELADSNWINFAYRRLAPYAQARGYIRQSFKPR